MTLPKTISPRTGVPYFRPSITDAEIGEVVETLRSGHITTGPRVERFERDFARFLGVSHAVALNSATGALHLALEAIGVGPGDTVIVPTMTFAATAEVVRHLGATPILVDCDRLTCNMDIDALARTIDGVRGQVACAGLRPPFGPLKAIITMHYGGQMVDAGRVRRLARAAGVHVVEDATHALPAFYREQAAAPWQSVGTTADITCFSFYANKSLTTGEGGMAVTNNGEWADRMRLMSLHAISRSGTRFRQPPAWSYHVVDAGYKYNMTDIAAAMGIHQLHRADKLWQQRRAIAARYTAVLGNHSMFAVPAELPDRQHAWHLYALQLRLEAWRIDRDEFIDELTERKIGSSVHWMPLHMHPYYHRQYGYAEEDFPVAAGTWPRLVSLPIFPDMTDADQDRVCAAILELAARFGA